MTRTHWLTAVCCLVAITLTGCSEQLRSRLTGSNTSEQEDVAEILARQRELAKAENTVIAVVKADTARWAQHEFGWWYHYTSISPQHVNYTHPPLPMDTCYWIHESVYTLDGSKLLHDAVRLYDNRDCSRHDEPFVYQIMLEEMVPGDTVTLLVPWIMAYGEQGKTNIPPRTNCRIRLTRHTAPCTDAALIIDTDNNIIIMPDKANQYETFYPVYSLPAAPDDRSNIVQPE